ncbi:MAG: short-chain dehydrogenase [Ilumatobacteraceae bacterium]|nr:short-chain dehydrogenase [Ilumatobacteraceae bacterium]
MTPTESAFRLDDRVVVITGGGQGIGEATAIACADAGAHVVVMARTQSDLEHVADQVRARGRQALVLPGDVNDLDYLAAALDAVVGELGRLDVLVNNAGGSMSRPFTKTTVKQLESSFHFNVSAAFELSRLALPHLLESGHGSIVNISSVAGRKAARGSLTHSLTKAAVSQLTRLMASELSPRVRVNAVLPGAIETAALRNYVSAEIREEMARKTPMRRNGTPMDIALAVLFLASDASSWTTGQLLDVDGLAPDDLVPREMPDL